MSSQRETQAQTEWAAHHISQNIYRDSDDSLDMPVMLRHVSGGRMGHQPRTLAFAATPTAPDILDAVCDGPIPLIRERSIEAVTNRLARQTSVDINYGVVDDIKATATTGITDSAIDDSHSHGHSHPGHSESMTYGSGFAVRLYHHDSHGYSSSLTNEMVGGKALKLWHMSMLLSHANETKSRFMTNAQVPPAIGVTSFAHDEHLHRAAALESATTLMTDVDLNEQQQIEIMASIRAAIMDTPVSNDLLHDIQVFLNENAHVMKSVAVRSSGTAEDGIHASFAGQYETFLNVPLDISSIARAIKQCWCSVWQERILAYRQRMDVESAVLPSMGVVVQSQLEPTCAGVLFTVDYMTGNERHMAVESCWGLGEGVVNGQVSPHKIVYDWVDEKVLQHSVPEQLHKFVFVDSDQSDADNAAEFVHKVSTTEYERTNSSNSAEIASLLAKVGCLAAMYYGRPQDLEWAVQDDQLYILQCRPVTKFSVCSPSAEWTYAGFMDSCVLSGSMCGFAYNEFLQNFAQCLERRSSSPLNLEYDGSEPDFELYTAGFRIIFGRVYLHMNKYSEFSGITNRYLNIASIGDIDNDFLPLFKLAQNAFDQDQSTRDTIRAAVLNDQTIADDTIVALFKKLWHTQDTLDIASFSAGRIVSRFEGYVSRTLSKHVNKQANPSLMQRVVRAFSSNNPNHDGLAPITIEQLLVGFKDDSRALASVEQLRSIARQIHQLGEPLVGMFCNARLQHSVCNAEQTPFIELWDRIHLIADHKQKVVVTLIDEYINEHYFQSTTLDEDFSANRLWEEPWRVLSILATLLVSQKVLEEQDAKVDHDSFQQAHNIEFERVMTEAGGRFGHGDQALTRAAMFGEHVSALRRYLKWKEEIHIMYSKNIDALRVLAQRRISHIRTHDQALFERLQLITQDWYDGHQPQQVNNVWQSDVDTLKLLLHPELLTSGDLQHELACIVQYHSTTAKMFRNMTPPDTISKAVEQIKLRPAHTPCAMPQGHGTGNENKHVLYGVGCSSGSAIGRVIVLPSLQQMSSVQPGDILVTNYTDPSWTPLFSIIGGIVTEVGGALSHAAVVARECGIPHVSQLRNAMKYLHTGQQVRIDGDSGEVQPL
jgi:phosphohistidine swiveling domain-containing protein